MKTADQPEREAPKAGFRGRAKKEDSDKIPGTELFI